MAQDDVLVVAEGGATVVARCTHSVRLIMSFIQPIRGNSGLYATIEGKGREGAALVPTCFQDHT